MAQNSATIDSKYYSMSNPFEVPNLANLSTFNLSIKAGEKVPVTISGMDSGSTYYLKTNSKDKINNLKNNKITIDEP